MHKLVVMVALALVACEQGSSKVTAADCGKAVDALAKRAAADKQAAMKTKLVDRCVKDTWTREAVTCLTKATDKEAEKACRYHHFTQEQAEKLVNDADELLSNNAEVMAKMVTFRDQMCACKDSACAKRVSDDMTTWSVEMSKQQQDPPKMSEAEQKRAMEIGTTMGECMQKAMSADDGNSNPNVDTSASAAMAKMGEFKDQMCACKDSDCAKRVSDDMTVWSQKMAAEQKNPPKMTEADMKRATELGTRMGECMQAAMAPAPKTK
jgi:hypothetical protein